jgi:hypothetical protein
MQNAKKNSETDFFSSHVLFPFSAVLSLNAFSGLEIPNNARFKPIKRLYCQWDDHG